MTQPPQYPGTPEPPEEPGGQTPPPIPPQQPTSPYGAPPQQPSPYGAPPPQQPPPYGAPQQPAYGAPQQPYGAPAAYPGGTYPGGSYPGGPSGTDQQPSKAMAIVALVLSFLACTLIAGLVAIVLAIIVLVRGKDGRNHGKGLAIAALVISVLVMIGTVVVGVVAVGFAEDQAIENLEIGECINADDLTDASSDSIGLIDKVSCSEDHDGEVVGTSELTAEQASGGGADCTAVVDPDLLGTLDPATFALYGLTQDTSPSAGDAVACVAVHTDGSKLTEKLG